MINSNRSRNLTHNLVDSLGFAIVSGEYSPDAGLPSEAEICEKYQISRTATREAVKMLAAKGMLTSRPRRGITILSRDNWNLYDPDLLNWILKSAPGPEILRDFTHIRLAIEPQAAILACQRAEASDLSVIEDTLFKMRKAEDGLDDYLEADIAFHLSLLNASHNPFMIQLRSFIETALRVSVRFTEQYNQSRSSDVHDHNEIYRAIVAQDEQRAAEMCRKIHFKALEVIESRLGK